MRHIRQLVVRIEPFWHDSQVGELRVCVVVDGEQHTFCQAYPDDDFESLFARLMRCAHDAISDRVRNTPPKKGAHKHHAS